MNTARVVTVAKLRSLFDTTDNLNNALAIDILRVFSYEPPNSLNLKEHVDCIRGKDTLAAEILRKYHWYEGVEFSNWDEMEKSSACTSKARVLAIGPSSTNDRAIMSDIFAYYMTQCKIVKERIKSKLESGRYDSSSVRADDCIQLMYKTVANSMYGYINYKRSILYSPAVAAAITLFSRKIFAETTYLHENNVARSTGLASSSDPTWIVVYRDTDGAIVATHKRLTRDEEMTVLNHVNARLATSLAECASAIGVFDGKVALESEYSDSQLVTIMGKKKYWRALPSGSFSTRGFERNASSFIKNTVIRLQKHVTKLVDIAVTNVSPSAYSNVSAMYLLVNDPTKFFEGMFESLRIYGKERGIEEFAFNVPLNPRDFASNTVEARFIRSVIANYDYDVGDRARCVYILNRNNCGESVLRLLRDFDSKRDEINLYKIIRKFATYFLQLVEGIKRNEKSLPNNFKLTASAFDKILRSAYENFLKNDIRDDAYHFLFNDATPSIQEYRDFTRLSFTPIRL